MQEVRIGTHRLAGDLTVPAQPKGVVVFVHGSGSSRHSPRNRFVATHLNQLGFSTLLMDLLTEHEDRDIEQRFDIDLLTERLEEGLAWLAADPRTASLPVGLFGASTGAAAALNAAARDPGRFFAVVSRGGRPDLATDPLDPVVAPVLLIVGGDDDVVMGLNESALRQLPHSAHLEVIAGATHLFEEPGKLEEVATLAGNWFLQHVTAKESYSRRTYATAT